MLSDDARPEAERWVGLSNGATPIQGKEGVTMSNWGQLPCLQATGWLAGAKGIPARPN